MWVTATSFIASIDRCSWCLDFLGGTGGTIFSKLTLILPKADTLFFYFSCIYSLVTGFVLTIFVFFFFENVTDLERICLRELMGEHFYPIQSSVFGHFLFPKQAVFVLLLS